MVDQVPEDESRILITIEQAARRLSVARSTLYVLLQSGDLPSVRVGRCRRIAVSDLENLVDQLRTAPAQKAQNYDADEGDFGWIDDVQTASGRR